MVCSPHRYIVAGVAQGLTYDTGVPNTLGYTTRPVSAYQKQYEQQTTKIYGPKENANTNYNTQKQTESETIDQKTNQYGYGSLDTNQQSFDFQPAIPNIADSYVPLRPRQLFFPEQKIQEAPMTNQNTKQTKQKLAQLIMNELDALGPREEHTHEHGEHTHVH